ncbi:MAG: DUF167 domain-containing protein [Deltaproteobacteria bacterium]
MKLQVKVVAKASRERVREEAGRLKVYVTAPPEDGKANAACRKLLSLHFGVPLKNVALMRGHRSPQKLFSIEER